MSRKTRYDVDILAAKDKKMKEQEKIDRDPKIQKLMAEWRASSPSNRWKEDAETIDEYAERYHRKQAQVAAQVASQVASQSAQVADKSAYKKTSPSHKGGKKSKKNRRTANKKSRK